MAEVVAALIWREGKFMICRPPNMTKGLPGEFSGNKGEPGKTKEQAPARECYEELDIILSVDQVFIEIIHEYPNITVRLTLFNAIISEGTPKLLEHSALELSVGNESIRFLSGRYRNT